MFTLTVWLYGCSCTSSGAMYNGVPLIEVRTIVLHDMARAKPKSHSLTVPCEPIKMFWGFMSLRGGGGGGVADHDVAIVLRSCIGSMGVRRWELAWVSQEGEGGTTV